MKTIETALFKETQNPEQLSALLSTNARNYLEEMAQKARQLTLQHFGKTIQLYTPLYLSNYCDNQCLYCGFNSKNIISRKKLELKEVEKEAKFIASTGLKNILILTGESRKKSPLNYIKNCVKILKKYFSSISIEIYPLTENEYAEIISEGVDGLTIYQETYNENLYAKLHPVGPKKNYKFRISAPDRAAKNGIRSINIGVLLGLDKWQKDVFSLGMHAKYLQSKFPEVEIGISVPRLKSHTGNFNVPYEVTDSDMVQIILALRIFLPNINIALSTRENAKFRDNLLPLGITKMSAGSTTKVGGHTTENIKGKNPAQFEISDERTVDEIKTILEQKGYQPVFKNWLQIN